MLVHSAAERDALRVRFGDSLVFTVADAKGLEFNDVLLWNFFAASAGTKKAAVFWWLAYGHHLGTTGRPADPALAQRVPEFDPRKHAVFCSWLKELYVAISRARLRFWVIEENVNVIRPVGTRVGFVMFCNY